MTATEKCKNDRYNLNPETLQDLQESLYDWQGYNFGEDQDNELVLLGVCEEAGELCHSHLKLEQAIRGTPAQHEADIQDAIGDIMIYLLNYVSGLGEVFPSFVAKDGVEKIEDLTIVRKTIFSVYRTIGKLADDPENMTRVQHVTASLIHLCAIKGLDLESIVRKTWAHIGKRDWKQFPENGRPPEEPSAPSAVSPHA